MRPGLWQRAGLSGLVTGIDWSAALAALPEGANRDLALACLSAGEIALIKVAGEKASATH